MGKTEGTKKRAVAGERPKPEAASRGYVAVVVQKLQKPTGFTKTSNFILFLITAGVFGAFCVAKFKDLDYYETWRKGRAPGEWYWFKDGIWAVGMKIHLWSVIPAGSLMPLQFVPMVRRKYMTFHKYSGRLLLTLLMIANLSAPVIATHAMGGNLATQIGVCALLLETTFTTFKGYRAIRNLHIDQHRTWMIRTWGYAGSILTLRIILMPLIFAAKLFPMTHSIVSTCHELIFMYDGYALPLENLYAQYPACQNITSSDPVYVVVHADIKSPRPEEIGAIISLAFGVAVWMAQLIHVFAVETYLHFTEDEDRRLKAVSVARRKAAGLLVDTEDADGTAEEK